MKSNLLARSQKPGALRELSQTLPDPGVFIPDRYKGHGRLRGRLRLPSRRLGDHRGSAVASTAGQSLILRLKLNIRLVRVAEELGDQLLHEVVETHLLLSEGKYPSRCIC